MWLVCHRGGTASHGTDTSGHTDFTWLLEVIGLFCFFVHCDSVTSYPEAQLVLFTVPSHRGRVSTLELSSCPSILNDGIVSVTQLTSCFHNFSISDPRGHSL